MGSEGKERREEERDRREETSEKRDEFGGVLRSPPKTTKPRLDESKEESWRGKEVLDLWRYEEMKVMGEELRRAREREMEEWSLEKRRRGGEEEK